MESVGDIRNLRFDTMKLINVFTKGAVSDALGVKPSVYINEVRRDCEERQTVLTALTVKEMMELLLRHGMTMDPSQAKIYEKWDVRPRFVFFNNWAAGKEYTAVFSVRNKYRTSKHLKAELMRNPEFSVEDVEQFRRIGSMVTARFRVRFRPSELKDYLGVVRLSTEGESVPVYVLAIGPRPMINFPDKIHFDGAFVNLNNKKTIELRNTGQITAAVSFETNGYVASEEDKLAIGPGEICDWKITLNSPNIGFTSSKILASYETGEKVWMEVTGDCREVDVRLDKTLVEMQPTHTTLESTNSLRLKNNSDRILKFKWLRNESKQADLEMWKSLCLDVEDLVALNRRKIFGLKFLDIVDDFEHNAALDRVLQDETAELRNHFYFNDDCFHIKPMSGEIWPKGEINFLVSFTPKEAKKYRMTAFLEVEGLEKRHRVTFGGEGVGPKLALNVCNIDFGQTFMGSQHTYLVLVKNLGLIRGRLRQKPAEILCGGEITCSPPEIELLPGETKVVELVMTSSVSGPFIEEVFFKVVESGEEHKITVKGELINPILTTDKREIDFGDIPLGLPVSKTVRVRNDSPIPVEIQAKVEGDGFMPPIRVDLDMDLYLPPNPKEFTVEPQEAVVDSGCVLELTVTVISNKVRKLVTYLNIYFWDVRVDTSSVRLTYNSVVAQLDINPPEIIMRHVFTDYEYCYKLTIGNQSTVPAYYDILPQERTVRTQILYRVEEEAGFIPPNSCQVLKLFIKVLSLKPSRECARLRVFGKEGFISACCIKAYGMGPVVNPSASSLSWGKVKIMEAIEKTFSLINVSPIPAYFKLSVTKHSCVWQVREKEGHIAPDSSMDIHVTATVLDSGPIEDKLWIEITGSRDVFLKLTAIGFGISIITEPNIFPLYDIGNVFKRERHKEIVKVKNVGTKHHTILFTTMKEIKKMTKVKAAQEQGKYFKLNPYRLDLPGGASEDVVLSYKWDDDADLEDTYYCYATINNRGKRVVLGTSTIKARFEDPQFYFEPGEVIFRQDVSPQDEIIGSLRRTLKLKSLWKSTLMVECTLRVPFRFGGYPLDDPRRLKINLDLDPGAIVTLEIYFDPPNLETKRNKSIKDTLHINYKGHTTKTAITLIGEVNFPNVSLDTKYVDFGCVSPGNDAVYPVQIKNISPQIVNFEWVWETSNIYFLEAPEKETEVKDLIKFQSLPNLSECYDPEKPDRNSVFPSELMYRSSSSVSSHSDLCRSLIMHCTFSSENSNLPKNIEEFMADLVFAKNELMKSSLDDKRGSDFRVRFEERFNMTRVPFYTNSGVLDPSVLTSKFEKQSSFSKSFRESISLSLLSYEKPEKIRQTLGMASSSGSSYIEDSEQSIVSEKLQDVLNQLPPELANRYDVLDFSKICHREPDEMESEETDNCDSVPDISKLVTITPCEDRLESNECLMATFTFTSKTPLVLHGSALCQVEGGPDEYVDIDVICYPVQALVAPHDINFGFGLFCEVWNSMILVWNQSLKEVKISLTTQQLSTFDNKGDTRDLPAYVGIYPIGRRVKPFETSLHRIAIFPGKVGDICQPILVQVENEEPVHVHFVGYATPSQIHLDVPRMPAKSSFEKDWYNSIARLTSSWFSLSLRDHIKGAIADFDLFTILKDLQTKYESLDYDIFLSQGDLTPNIDDINMAYERYLFEELCKTLDGPVPNHNPKRSGAEVIPYIIVPPYIADFGLVIADTKALYTITYSNYLPIKAVFNVKQPKDEAVLDKFGVVFKMQYKQYLAGHEQKQFDIFIRPTSSVFRGEEFESNMEFSFQFQVLCGGTIPIIVRALVTYPVLDMPHILDFDGVKVKYRREIKFNLRNISKVDCEWVAVLAPATGRNYLGKKWLEKCPYSVQPQYGYLKPNQFTQMTVVFEPTLEIPYEYDIQFIVNMSNIINTTRLRGFGMEKGILIRNVDFGYSVPFSKPLKRHLTAYNPTIFPIEIYIYGKDRLHSCEEKINKQLLSYFNKLKICLPSHFFTTQTTDHIWRMYKQLALNAIRKYIQDMTTYVNALANVYFARWRSGGLHSSDSDTAEFAIQRRTRVSKTMVLPSKSIKTLKAKSRFNSQTRQSLTYFEKQEVIEMLLLKEVPCKNLDDVIKDYITHLKSFKCNRENLIEIDTPHRMSAMALDKKNPREGCVIILHPSPHSSPGLFSWLLKKYGGMKAFSIDSIILSELSQGTSEESLMIQEILFNFLLQQKERAKIDASLAEMMNPKVSVKSFKGLVEFAEKLNFGDTYLSMKKKGQNGTPHSTTLLNIPPTYFKRILINRCNKYKKSGIVIKTLYSKFFSSPLETLKFLLDSFKSYKEIHIMSLYSTLNMHLKLKKDLIDLNLIETFKNMTGKDIFEVSPEFIKQFGESLAAQQRVLTRGKKKEKEKPSSRKLRTPSFLNLFKEQPKMSKHFSARVSKANDRFMRYEKELWEIKSMIDISEKHKETVPRGSDQLEPKASWASFRFDDPSSGVWFWILNNYPYDKTGYQFTSFPPFIVSYIRPGDSAKVRKSKEEPILSKTSYFVVSDTHKDKDPQIQAEEMSEGGEVFRLQNFRKFYKYSLTRRSYQRHSRKSNNFDDDWDLRSNASSIGTGGGLGQIKKFMSIVESDLLIELDDFLDLRKVNPLYRQKVQPSKFVSWEVHFEPQGCREYTQIIPFGISGCEQVRLVRIFAGCDIPDISFDPYVMFQDVIEENYAISAITRPCYLLPEWLFHFGMIITNNNNGGNFFVEYPVTIKNISKMNTNISVSLVDENILDSVSAAKPKFSKSKMKKISGKSQFLQKQHVDKRHHNVYRGVDRKRHLSGEKSLHHRSGDKSRHQSGDRFRHHSGDRFRRHSGEKIWQLTTEKKRRYSLRRRSIFTAQSDKILIEAGDESKFNITSFPIKDGMQSIVYLFSIENNPKIYTLKAYTNGIIVKVEFRPKEIVFGEIVLYRSSKKCFMIENTTDVPLIWKILEPESLLPQIALGKSEGVLEPRGSEAVLITYHAYVVEKIVKDMVIAIYSPLNKTYELQRYVYHLNLRSYSVDVSLYFDLTKSDHLILGDIALDSEINTMLTIENTGVYSITYTIIYHEEALRDIDFQVFIQEKMGRIRSKDQHKVELLLVCHGEVKIKRIQFITIEITDHSSDELIARIPAYISAQSYSPEFVLKPTQQLDFGDLQMGDTKYMDFVIENVGFIDLDFQIVEGNLMEEAALKDSNSNGALLKPGLNNNDKYSPSDYINNIAFLEKILLVQKQKYYNEKIAKKLGFYVVDPSEEKVKALQKKMKSIKFLVADRRKPFYKVMALWALKTKNRWKKLSREFQIPKFSSLRLDGPSIRERFENAYPFLPFEVDPNEGKIKRGESEICRVYCSPQSEGVIEKEICLKVKNARPEHNNVPIYLRVKCSKPKVDFNNIMSMFREFEVIEKWQPRNTVHNKGFHYGVFSKDDGAIRFCNVIVGSSVTYNIYLKSETHLISNIEAIINGGVFSINDSSLYSAAIPPYDTHPIAVTFSPENLHEYTGSLGIKLKSHLNATLEIKYYQLIGIGQIPQIEIQSFSPPLPSDEVFLGPTNIHNIDFNQVVLDETSRKTFDVINTSLVVCDMWFELPKKNENFSLKYKSTEKPLNDEDTSLKEPTSSWISFNSSTPFQILPKEKITFEASFHPSIIGTYVADVPVHLVYNPYELNQLKLTGEGYQDDVMIRCLNRSLPPTPGSRGIWSGVNTEYDLDFGSCGIYETQKKKFIVQNHSEYILRFEIVSKAPELVFMPTIGHIFPKSEKDIYAFFSAGDQPSSLEVIVSFHHSQIIYKDEVVLTKEWDNALIIIQGVEETGILTEIDRDFFFPRKNFPYDEPGFVTMSTSSGEILILAKAIVDLPVIELSKTFISYDTVLIGQSQELVLELKNISLVDAYFSLSFRESDVASGVTDRQSAEIADFAFGKYTCKINRESKYSEIKSKHNLRFEKWSWPATLPPELESTEYRSLLAGGASTRGFTTCTDEGCKIKLRRISNSSQQTEFIRTSEIHPVVAPGHVFELSVKEGVIRPNESIEVTVKFSPRHITKYNTDLVVSVENAEDEEELVAKLHGTGYLPLCHMEIEEIDFILTPSRLLKKVPYMTKIIKLTAFSDDSILKKQFNVFNLSDVYFNFKWYYLKGSSSEQKVKCLVEEGTVRPERKAVMKFSYCPLHYGSYEALWLFCIQEFVLQQPILFVGTCKDPEVEVEPNIITLPGDFAGEKTYGTVNLVNHEESDLKFTVVESSLVSNTNSLVDLSVSPMSGTVPAGGEIPLKLEYLNDNAEEASFTVYIKIDSSKKTISLRVFTKTIVILPIVTCFKENLEKLVLQPGDNNLYIGKLNVGDAYTLSFNLTNDGKLPLHFETVFEKNEGILVDIMPVSAIVLPQKDHTFQAKLVPLVKLEFDQMIGIKVSKGPHYYLNVSGNTTSPCYKFTFDTYDFGHCIINKIDPNMHTVVLGLMNFDTNAILLELEEVLGNFVTNFKVLNVEPRTIHEIVVIFRPFEPVSYEGYIRFRVCNMYSHQISFRGHGAAFKLSLEGADDQLLDFGLVQAGCLVAKDVKVTNKSLVSVEFSLYLQEIKSDKKCVALQINRNNEKIGLEPGGSCVVKVKFHGYERFQNFSSAVMYKAYGIKEVLFCVRGSVIGFQFSVDQETIVFEPTVIGCSSTLKFALTNSGDIGSPFKIDTSLVADVFVVRPVNGYLPPSSSSIIEVTFIPTSIMQYYNNMLICQIENWRPLPVNITGVGIRLPLPERIVKFATHVRKEVKRDVTLSNKIALEQIVIPILSGQYFSCAEHVKIQPFSNTRFFISYKPLTQTKFQFHEGSLFCQFPNGEGHLFKLLGTALPPTFNKEITWSCPKGKKTIKTIPVENTSIFTETFKVKISPECNKNPVFYQLEMDEIISVPAKQTRHCFVKFLCYQKISFRLQAELEQIHSSEFTRCFISVEVEPREEPVTKRLVATPRERLSIKVPLPNPTQRKLTFFFKSPHPDIYPSRKTKKVNPGKKGFLNLRYKPIMHNFGTEIRLRTWSRFTDRTEHIFNISLLKPVEQDPVLVQTNIGSNEYFTLTVNNPGPKLASFCLKIPSYDLHVKEPIFTVPSGKSYNIKVRFSPSTLGTFSTIITVISDEVENFIFPVKTVALPPRPRGTFTMRRGEVFSLPFKNVMRQRITFTCELNNPEFVCRNPTFTLGPGETQKIDIHHVEVTFFTICTMTTPSCVKLAVTAKTSPSLVWVFYFKTD